MSQHLNFKGQDCTYNQQTKTMLVTIEKPYVNAGKDLGWEEDAPGIGLNLEILTFLLQRNLTLMVRVLRDPKDNYINRIYWIPLDRLKEFLKTHDCNKIKNGVELRVISWKKFIRYVEHEPL